MKECRKLLIEGKKLLFTLKSHEAMNKLRQALEKCECRNFIELGEILFYLGLAFSKMGHKEYARRCWLNAFNVRDIAENTASLKTEQHNNAEWNMFHSIQLSRYLSQKRAFRFDTLAEGDMVHDLIKATWMEIYQLPQLRSMSSKERVNYYYTITIVFPEMNLKEVRKYFNADKIVSFLQ